MTERVSNVVYNTLKRLRIKHVFGYTGGAILPVVDEFYRKGGPRLIVPKTELGASFMAEGYAKMKNNKEPGVVLATSGPGATNLVTSLQNAKMDGTPLIALTGQVSTGALGTDAFQEADIVGITRPCTKWNIMLQNGKEIEEIIKKGYKISVEGRPGPVLVDLPKNVTSSMVETEKGRERMKRGLGIALEEVKKGNEKDIKASKMNIVSAMKAMEEAKNPVIIAGQGALGDAEGVRNFARSQIIPVASTLLGLGVVDERERGSLGMAGMHGSYTANMAIQMADTVLVLGARLDDRLTGYPKEFGKNARRIIHIDNHRIVKERTVKGTEFINEKIEDVLNEFGRIEKGKVREERIEWMRKLEKWKEEFPFRVHKNEKKANELSGSGVMSYLDEIIKSSGKKVCIVADVGAHQMWAAQYINYDFPRVRYITSGGLGSMGFALSAAMGAKIARPDYEVICVIGDGGFNMCLHELRTIVDQGINIKVMVMNNSTQQMVKMWQDYFYEGRYIGVDNKNPKYDEVAKSMGIKGERIENEKCLEKKLGNVMFEQKAKVYDVIIDGSEYVYPMVMPGKGLDEMVLEKSKEFTKGKR